MPSNTRNTTRVSASIDSNVATELEKFADDVNETKSRIVENALKEYLGMDRVSEVNEKLDQVLARLDGSDDPTPTLGENDVEKEKENSGQPDGGIGYDPDADRDQELTTDEIHSIISTPDPVINPEHVGNRIPRDSGPKVKLLLACARYDQRHPDRDEPKTVHRDEVEDIVEEVLGGSDHIINKYTPLVLDELHRLERANYAGEVIEMNVYAFGTEGRREWYQKYISDELESASRDFFTYQEDLRQYRTQVDEFRDEFLELGIVDEEKWQSCRNNLYSIDISQLPQSDADE